MTWRRRMEEREEKRGTELGGAAVRLNSEKRDMRGLNRRSRRELLIGGGVMVVKYKERGSYLYGEIERDRERRGVGGGGVGGDAGNSPFLSRGGPPPPLLLL